MNYCHKGVYLIKVHHSASGLKKIRPAILVQNNNLNKYAQTCTVIPLSTKVSPDKSVYEMEMNYTFLDKQSYAITYLISTVKKSAIIKQVGVVSDADYKRLITLLNLLFSDI